MAPYPAVFIGYLCDNKSLEEYRKQHGLSAYNNRELTQHLQTVLDLPVALVRVDDDAGSDEEKTYLCCYVDFSGWRTYDIDELAAVPVPSAFKRLPEFLPNAILGDIQRLFAPRTHVHARNMDGSILKTDVFNAIDAK